MPCSELLPWQSSSSFVLVPLEGEGGQSPSEGQGAGREREKGAVSLPGYRSVLPVWNCLAGDETGALTWRLKVETTTQAHTTSSWEGAVPE